MSETVSTAASALRAASTRIAAIAENTANRRRDGQPGADGMAVAFQPLRTDQESQADGGVRAQVSRNAEGTVLRYDPESPMANAEGMVESPAMPPESQLLERIRAEKAYSASIDILKVHRRMSDELKTLL